MKIKRIILKNIGPFKSLDISLAPTDRSSSNTTIFVGNNGAGKTSILKALATSLSWFTSRLRTEKGGGHPILEEAITNNANVASIEMEVWDSLRTPDDFDRDESTQSFRWILAKTRRGRNAAQYTSDLTECSHLASLYRNALTQDDKSSLPLIVFYPTERVVLDIPLKIKTKHTFLQLDSYENSLTQGVDFRRFFEWFREREDAENESRIPEHFLNRLELMFEANPSEWQQFKESIASTADPQLTAVRTAIYRFMPHMANLRVRRKPRLHMAIDKSGETLNVSQLSQGEKSLMALVGDIARRLAMLNPDLDDPLTGNGIVLIDEADLHLHPSWQRSLCSRLIETFPNCQFVLTTHSPLVISDCKNVLVYTLNDGESYQLPSQYGQDANTVLLEAMDTSIRNERIETELNNLLDAIQDSRFTEAQRLLEELTEELPANHLDLIKANLLLRRQKLRHESHQ